MTAFAACLKKFRADAGLTLAQMSKKLKVPIASLSQYERGDHEPRPEKLARILEALNDAAGNGPEPAPTAPKKRGRPRKEHLQQPPGRVKRGRPKKEFKASDVKPAERRFFKETVSPLVKKIQAEALGLSKQTEARGRQPDAGAIKKSPARLGQVSRAWIEQQADSFVHSRGLTLVDGQVRVVTMRRQDIIELTKLALESCGTMVLAEVDDD